MQIKMVVNINIEEILGMMANNNWYTEVYRKPFKAKTWKQHREILRERYESMMRSADEIWAVFTALCMEKEEIERMWIASRAVEKWRKRTNYERWITEGMQKQIANYVFQNKDGFVVEKSWYDGEYRRA